MSVLGIHFIFHERFQTHIKAVEIVQASKIHHSDEKQLSMNFQGSPVVKTSPSNVGGEGSILSQEDKLSHALRPKSQTIKQKRYFNKLKKDLQTLKSY